MSEAIIETMENAQPEAAEPVKPYTFRTLGGGDIFPMLHIINKIGIKDFGVLFENEGIKMLIAKYMKEKLESEGGNEGGNESPERSVTYISVALDVAAVVFSKMEQIEKEVFQLLSSTSNLSVEQVRKLPIPQFAEMIIDFIKKDEFKDFIKVVSRFLQ